MADFGVLEGNLIVNVIVAETQGIAETVTGKPCIEIPPMCGGIGWTYENGTFTAPTVEKPITSEAIPNPNA